MQAIADLSSTSRRGSKFPTFVVFPQDNVIWNSLGFLTLRNRATVPEPYERVPNANGGR